MSSSSLMPQGKRADDEVLKKRIEDLEKELAEQNRKMSNLMDIVNKIPDLLVQLVRHRDGSTDIRFINETIYKYAGYRPEEIISKPSLMFNRIHSDDIGMVLDCVKKSAVNLEEFFFDHRIVDPDNTTRWFHAKYTPSLLENGDIQWEGISTDITDRKRYEEALRENKKKYLALFEKTMDACAFHEIICDSKGNPVDYRFLAVNPAFERMTGFKADEIRGKTILEIKPDTNTALIKKYGKVALTGEPISFYSYLEDVDRHFEISVYQPEENQFACVIQDITTQKKTENDLKNAHADLERRVRTRTRELNRANEALNEKTANLEEVNTALKVLLERRNRDRQETEEKILLNVKELLIPYIDRLRKGPLSENQSTYLELLESGLRDIISPFACKLTSRYMHITPGEMQVANLVKDGRTSKEIAEMLNSTERAVVAHRSNLRKKLRLKSKSNLRTYLLSVQ